MTDTAHELRGPATPPAWERLYVDAGDTAAALLTPGFILRALALGAGVHADEVGAIDPIRRGVVAVEIAIARAVDVPTPRWLPITHERRAHLIALRRPDDPPAPEAAARIIRWSDGGDPPTPGALARAFAEATDLAMGAEALGGGFTAEGWLAVEVTPGAQETDGEGLTLSVDGRPMSIHPPGGAA